MEKLANSKSDPKGAYDNWSVFASISTLYWSVLDIGQKYSNQYFFIKVI